MEITLLRCNRSNLLLKREQSLNGNLYNKSHDCDHNESDRNDASPQNLETNAYVMQFGCVIKKLVRFADN